MTQQNKLQNQPIHAASMGKRMLQGAGIALILILMFLFSVGGEPDPSWSKFWIIKPLLMVPLAGALGGVFYYFMDYLRSQGGWVKIMAIIMSLIGYVVLVWIGTVLGLNGTMWD
ncbi:MAG: potassium transporter KefB [Bacteroidetes bacterium]|nr:potassium transporter KefB [Bacteroidota bacterium]